MSVLADLLLQGPWPELKSLKRVDAIAECEMWRRVWQWVPDEVKYYVARTGMLVGLTQRNYSRLLGRLLQTRWTIDEVELGVVEKTYDPNTGDWKWETKTVRTKLGSIIAFQFIRRQQTEEEFEEELAAAASEAEAREQEEPKPEDEA